MNVTAVRWPWLLRLSGARPGAPTRQPETVHLRPQAILTVKHRGMAQRVEVRKGIVWLTGGEGVEDIILNAGEAMELTNGWPHVLEALSEAEVVLLR